MTRSRSFAVRAMPALIAIALLTAAGGGAAQSPVPSSAVPTPIPTPIDDSGIDWPPMEFVGSDPAGQLTFTSECVAWGTGPIALHGEGSAGSTDLVVVLTEYESDASQWHGTVTGTFTGPNGVTVAIGPEGALIYYDFDLGQWTLVASWAGQIKADGCAMPSPSPAPS